MDILGMPWYYFIIYAGIGALILWIFDKFQIIKSKALRFLIVFFVYTLIWWLVYDFVIAPE